jgi:ParB family chromosome partitioning protein
VLAGLDSREEQLRLARIAAEEGMSVRRLEQIASAAKPKKSSAKRRTPELPAELNELQDKIRAKTGLKSTLTGSISKGRIVLQYSSRDELERFNEMMDLISEQ